MINGFPRLIDPLDRMRIVVPQILLKRYSGLAGFRQEQFYLMDKVQGHSGIDLCRLPLPLSVDDSRLG